MKKLSCVKSEQQFICLCFLCRILLFWKGRAVLWWSPLPNPLFLPQQSPTPTCIPPHVFFTRTAVTPPITQTAAEGFVGETLVFYLETTPQQLLLLQKSDKESTAWLLQPKSLMNTNKSLLSRCRLSTSNLFSRALFFLRECWSLTGKTFCHQGKERA